MKTRKSWMLGILLSALCSVSCDDDSDFDITDYANYRAVFTVSRTADKVDLLADSVFLANTYVEHRGLKYPVIQFGDKDYWYHTDTIQTRYNLPVKWALRLHKTKNGERLLTFGEFGPVEHYKNETFTINWADGTTNTVSFNLYLKGDDLVKNSTLDGMKGDFFKFDIKK